MERAVDLSLLQDVPLLQFLEKDALHGAIENSRSVSLGPRDHLFHVGDDADCLYVVVTGRLRVYRAEPDTAPVELQVIGPGDLVGELAMLEGGTRSASVMATAPSELLGLDRAAFWTLINQSPTHVVLHILADLSRRMRAANEDRVREQLQRQALRAEMELERHRSLALLVAGVAHEIGTPLGIANTAVEILRRDVAELISARPDDAVADRHRDITESLDLLTRSIARAHSLTHDFKRVSVGQMSSVEEQLDLVTCVREIVELFRASARQGRLGVHVHDELGPSASGWFGSYGHLSQVLLNLLTNAARYAYVDAIGGPVDVRIAASEYPHGSYTISVTDQGQGIPAENLPRVFDAFFTTGRSMGGSGLGLAVVYGLVTGPMRGDIAVSSLVGAGTTFTITVPAQCDGTPAA